MDWSLLFPEAYKFLSGFRRIIPVVLFMSFIMTPKSLCQELWFGKNKSGFVHAYVSEYQAAIDYCTHSGPGENTLTILDTLKLISGNYGTGKYRIKFRGNYMRFYPGNIKLIRCYNIDTSLFSDRIQGYSNARYEAACSKYIWIGKDNLSRIWRKQKKVPGETLPEAGYRMIDKKIIAFSDSVRSLSNSFDSLIVTDNKRTDKKIYLVSSDRTVITRIWCQLIETSASLKGSFYLFAIQGTIISCLFTAFDPALAVISVPAGFFISTGLTAGEMLIASCFSAGKTFVVVFYSNGIVIQKIRIRRDYIINEFFYRHKLSRPFNEIINRV
jgi:hypothetical protein